MKVIDRFRLQTGEECSIQIYDLEDIKAHEYLLLQLEEGAFGTEGFRNPEFQNFTDAYAEGDCNQVIVAEVNSKGKKRVVGFVRDEENQQSNYMLHHARLVCMLAVDPKYQHLGIGTKLLTNMLASITQDLRDNGKDYGFIQLNVHVDNIKAQQLYKKLGFKMFCNLPLPSSYNAMLYQTNPNLELLGDICAVALKQISPNASQQSVTQWFKKLRTEKALQQSDALLPVSRLHKIFSDTKHDDLYKAMTDTMVEFFAIRRQNNGEFPFERFVTTRVRDYYTKHGNVANTLGGVLQSTNDNNRPKDNHAPHIMQILKSAVVTMRDDLCYNENSVYLREIVQDKTYRGDILEINPKFDK